MSKKKKRRTLSAVSHEKCHRLQLHKSFRQIIGIQGGDRNFGRFDRPGVDHEKLPIPKTEYISELTNTMLTVSYTHLTLPTILLV